MGKKNKKVNISEDFEPKSNSFDLEEQQYNKKKVMPKKKKHTQSSFNNNSTFINNDVDLESNLQKNRKRSLINAVTDSASSNHIKENSKCEDRKKKKKRESSCNQEAKYEVDNERINNIIITNKAPKKNKVKDNSLLVEETNQESNIELKQQVKRKQKKINKDSVNKKVEETISHNENNVIEKTNMKSKKKKKSKNYVLNEDEAQVNTVTEEDIDRFCNELDATSDAPKKNKKEIKDYSLMVEETIQEANIGLKGHIKIIKKKKKDSVDEKVEETISNNEHIVTEKTKTKSKKKKKSKNDVLNEDEAQVTEEDIDRFCNELDATSDAPKKNKKEIKDYSLMVEETIQEANIGLKGHIKRIKKKKKDSVDEKVEETISNNEHIVTEKTNTKSKKKKKSKNDVLNEDEAQVTEEDIDRFCDELDEEDNKQFEDWVKLLEASLPPRRTAK